MKKKLLALALFASSTTVFAQANSFEGINASIGLGLSSVSSSQTNITSPADNGNGQSGGFGVLDLSYIKAIDKNFFLGVGATYDIGEINAGYQNWSPNYTYQAKLQNHYSAYIKPGFAVNDSAAIYAKLGYNWATAKINDTGEIIGSGNYSQNIQGFGYGLGTQIFLTKDIYTSVEVMRVNYNKVTFSDSGNNPTSFSAASTTGTVSVGYKF